MKNKLRLVEVIDSSNGEVFYIVTNDVKKSFRVKFKVKHQFTSFKIVF